MSAQELLQPLIIAARTPVQYRALATELERIAALCRAYADAQERQQGRPAAERATPRKPKAGPGRAPASFIRVVHEPWGKHGQSRLRLYVGRALWYAIGSPARLDLQRSAGQLVLRPAGGDAGIAFKSGTGMPRAFVDGWADLLRLEDGRYQGRVQGGAIVVGERMKE